IYFQSNNDFKIIIDNKNIDGKNNVEYKIERNNKNYHIYKEDKLISSLTSESNLSIKSTNKNSLFLIYDVNYGDGYFWASSEDRQYRGDFELYTVNDNNFNLVNIVNMAEYLYSVVPAEMPALWPLEALKAQSIAARSYALRHFDRHLDKGYNLCDSVHCAAYNGVKSEHQRTYEAVNETAKEVAYFNSRIIDAVFSSNSGGYTESSNDVWGNENEYLNGRSTMIDNDFKFPLESYDFNRWLKTSPPSYSKGDFASDNSYRWVKEINKDYFNAKYNFSELKEIKILERTKGGSVKSLKLTGIDKNTNEIKNKIINKDYIRSALTGLRSNRFIIDRIYNKDKSIEKLIIYGSGWGHNVGMDQTAAANMAKDNYNYKEIIKYFYNDIKISEYNLNK
ncbi:MAG: SpoIID/LytB domain-containing protein, partial [Bacillota bacterium]